ncbi:MAG: sigma-70 family RNA polymerase sigma factor [Isosphaeraceae bacterium]|jgi:RNA polymerase sigma-70 factor (ECF subfamily)
MDPDLLGNLLDQHADAIELYARQWCDVPEDVVQDAFLKLAAERTLPDNPAAWLFRVVRNGAIDAGQAARRRKRYETTAASRAPPWFEADPDERPEAVDPEQAASELQALPIEEREIIVAHLWGGLTFEHSFGEGLQTPPDRGTEGLKAAAIGPVGDMRSATTAGSETRAEQVYPRRMQVYCSR